VRFNRILFAQAIGPGARNCLSNQELCPVLFLLTLGFIRGAVGTDGITALKPLPKVDQLATLAAKREIREGLRLPVGEGFWQVGHICFFDIKQPLIIGLNEPRSGTNTRSLGPTAYKLS